MERASPQQFESVEERFDQFSSIVDRVQPLLDAVLDPTNKSALLDTYDLTEAGFNSSSSLENILDLPQDCQYLATGLSSVTIRHTNSTGDYVLRFPRSQDPHERTELVEYRKNTRLWGKGVIPGVEEIVALSYQTGVVATRFIEGTPALTLSDIDKETLTSSDLGIARNTLERLHARGLCMDNYSNYLINPNATGRKIFFIDPAENSNPARPRTVDGDFRRLKMALNKA